jgi:hypothetical protein
MTTEINLKKQMEGIDWINLTQDRDRQASKEMNLGVNKCRPTSQLAEELSASQEILCFLG